MAKYEQAEFNFDFLKEKKQNNKNKSFSSIKKNTPKRKKLAKSKPVQLGLDFIFDAFKEDEGTNGSTKGSNVRANESHESGSDTNGSTQPGIRLGSSPDLVDGQSAGMDRRDVPEGQRNITPKASQHNTESVSPESNHTRRGKPGRRSDRRSHHEQDSSSTNRPGSDDRGGNTHGRRDEAANTSLERQPSRSGLLKPEDRNHVIAEDDILFPAGPETKIKANIKSIQLLKKLESEDRNPSSDEKRILAQYVGWGAFAQKVFNKEYTDFHKPDSYTTPESRLWGSALEKYKTWKEKYGEKLHPGLGGLLTEDEWKSAAASTLNAHYTSKDVIKNVWSLAERMGFKGGQVLEPSAGVGHFIGLSPEHIKNKTFQGVELDAVSGRILNKLYPEANTQVAGFEKSKGLPNNSMDLVVSNFPFGDYKVFDKDCPEYSKWSIHNYFFGKSIDKVKPGGLVIGITSHYTLDSVSGGSVRKKLNEKADFIGAIRLPSTAFKKDAGTEVTTDILVFRKKDETQQIGERFRLTNEIQIGDDQASINEYFIKHPEMVMGEHSLSGTMYGGNEYTVLPNGNDLSEQLKKAVSMFPENIMGVGRAEKLQETIYADESSREGVLTLKDSKIYTVQNGRLVTPTLMNTKNITVDAINSDARKNRTIAYIDLRDSTSHIIKRMQEFDASDKEINELRVSLDNKYDGFVKKYNRINSIGNSFLRKIDNDFPIVDALENEHLKPSPEGKQVRSFSKADLLKKRTIYPFKEPDQADNLQDALSISMVYKSKVDVNYISSLTGQDEKSVKTDILKKELAYINPSTGLLETPDKYLSGNVKKKLIQVKDLAKKDKSYELNVKALEAAQPEEIDLDFIHFKLGSSWIPEKCLEDFTKQLSGIDVTITQARTEESNQWTLNKKNAYETNAKNSDTWGVEGADALQMIKDSLNLKRSNIYESYYDDNNRPKRRINKEKSLVAQKKQEDIQNEFRSWARSAKEWSPKLTEIYNREYNGFKTREFSVPNIDYFPGANKEIKLRPLQKKAVSRCLQESTLLSYGVGTGKTFTYVSLAMEMRRLKTARKPMIVVQGSTVKQFSSAFKTLYPQAKVLIPNDQQRTAKNRKKLLSQIATGDWDAVVVPHSFFDGIADDPKRESALIQEHVNELEESLKRAAEEDGKNSPTVKQMEKAKKNKLARLEKLQDRRVDNTLTFEQMGIDALLIDEAHAYKRSEFSTKMGNIKGIDSGASQRSSSLILKSNYIREKTGNKNIILATGTPISNTTAELWTMIRYVKPELLAEYNVSLFDDFAANFGDTSITTEETDTGDFKEVERFNKFANGPELMTLFHTASDVVLTKDANLNLPKVKGGKAKSIVIQRSPELGSFIDELREERKRFEKMTGKEKMKNRHIPLVVFGKAKKAAIDLQLVNPGRYADDPDSKLNHVSRNVHRVWQDTINKKSTQVIFLDNYQDASKTFNAYTHIKNKLVGLGVPEREIICINDAKNDSQKEAAFQKIRTGEARVIIGSTFKLGIGVNMQDKLIAAHHVDVPLRPMDIEQRNGRIVREGNENKEVQIFNYGVKNTLDSVMYDRLIKKQKFIDQMLNGEISGREFDDPLGEEQISFAEMNAAFSGNPLLFEKSDVNIKIKELEILKQAHIRNVSSAKRDIRNLERRIPILKESKIEAEKGAVTAKRDFPENTSRQFEISGKKMSQKDFIKEYNKILDEREKHVKSIYHGISKKAVEKNMENDIDKHVIDAKINGYPVRTVSRIHDEFESSMYYSNTGRLDLENRTCLDVSTSIKTKENEAFLSFPGKQFTKAFNKNIELKKSYPSVLQEEIDKSNSNLNEFKNTASKKFEHKEKLTQLRSRLREINTELESGPIEINQEQQEKKEDKNPHLTKEEELKAAFKNLDKKEAVKKYPELNDLYSLTEKATKYAEISIGNEDSRNDFVQKIQERSFSELAKGNPLPNSSINQDSEIKHSKNSETELGR